MSMHELLVKSGSALLPTLKKVQREIQKTVDVTERDKLDADERLLYDRLTSLSENQMDQIVRSLEYLVLPVKYTGELHRNSEGRYELGNGYYFSSGYGIELFIPDEQRYTDGYWITTRIEHNGDYYAVGAPKVPLQGALARYR